MSSRPSRRTAAELHGPVEEAAAKLAWMLASWTMDAVFAPSITRAAARRTLAIVWQASTITLEYLVMVLHSSASRSAEAPW